MEEQCVEPGDLWDGTGDPHGIARKRQLMDVQRLRQLVIRDDLTELYNRRYFKERLREEKKRGDLQGLPFSLMILDVDHFKEINDHYGHVTGDRVLVQIARIIADSVREIDISCRYAGDEFVVILPGAGEEETEGVIQRLVNNLNAFLWEERLGIDLPKLTCSVGFSCYPEDARDLSQLIKRADRALYLSKKKGRDGWLRWNQRSEALFEEREPSRADQTLEMVGRVKERERILQIVERAKGGAGRAVVISGEMGIGKTRLVKYAMMRLKDQGFMVLMINCFKETAEIPYLPIREALSCVGERFRAKLEGTMAGLEPKLRQELSKIFPLKSVPPIPWPSIKDTPAVSDKFLLYEAFLQFLSLLAQESPIAVVVENIQWIDFSSRELLNYISRSVSHDRIIIIGSRRIGIQPASPDLAEKGELDGSDSVEEIRLRNLTLEESSLLAEALVGNQDLPKRYLENLYQRTAGNPLFIEEMVNYLRHEGDELKGGPASGVPLSIPGSVLEMLRGQVDALQEDRRSILAMASVIGVEFGFDLLMLLSLKNEGFLLDVMDDAVRQRILKEMPHPHEDRYAFVNPLFHQVLYEGINKRRRRNLHLQIGKFLEKYYFDRIEELYGELAYHFQQGCDLSKALTYTVKAGRRARELFANHEVILYHDRALKILADSRDGGTNPSLALRLIEEKGDVYDLIGELGRAEESYLEVREKLIEGDGPRGDLARILGKLGLVRDKMGNPRGAIENLEEGMAILGRDEGMEKARLLCSLADIYLRQGDSDLAITYCKQGLKALPHVRESVVGARIYLANGCAHLEKGEVGKAKYNMNRGIEIFESKGDLRGLGKAYLSMGTLYYTRGNYKMAEEYYKKSMNLASKTGSVSLLQSCYNNLGMIARAESNLNQAVGCWEEGLTLAEKFNHCRNIAYMKNNLGNAYRELGDFSRALGLLEESAELFQKLKSEPDVRRVNRGLAILFLRLGDVEAAERVIRLNDPGVGPETDQVDRLMDIDVLGRVLREKGEYDLVEPLFLRALEGYRKVGDPEDITVGLLNLAELYVDWGRYREAWDYRDEAEKISKKYRLKKFLAHTLLLRGMAVILSGRDSAETVPALQRALRIYRELDLPYLRMLTHHHLGLAYEKQGKTAEAAREFGHGAEMVRYMKRKIIEPGLLRKFEGQPPVHEVMSRGAG